MREYPPYQVFEAQDMFVLDGQTYQDVSQATGIPQSTLKRWGKKYDWTDKRSELRESQSNIRANQIRLRAKLVKDCLDADRAKPLDVFAVAKLEEAALQAERFKLERRSYEPLDVGSLSAEDAVAAFERAVVAKIAGLLADPSQLELKAVGEIRKALDLIRTAKEAEADEKTTAKPLSKDIQRRIEEALGLL